MCKMQAKWQRNFVFIYTLMGAKHSHKVMQKRGEDDSLEQNI